MRSIADPKRVDRKGRDIGQGNTGERALDPTSAGLPGHTIDLMQIHAVAGASGPIDPIGVMAISAACPAPGQRRF